MKLISYISLFGAGNTSAESFGYPCTNVKAVLFGEYCSDETTNQYSAYYDVVKSERSSWLYSIGSWWIIGFRDGWASGSGYGGEVEMSEYKYEDFTPCAYNFNSIERRDQAKDLGGWFVCSESPTEFTSTFSEWSEWSCCSDKSDIGWSSSRQRTCLSDNNGEPAVCDGKDFVVAKCKCFVEEILPKSCAEIEAPSETAHTIYPFAGEAGITVDCDFTVSPHATYLSVSPDTTYSYWAKQRQSSGWLCDSFSLQANYNMASRTSFSKVRLEISEDSVTINKDDTSHAEHDSLWSGGDTNKKPLGSGGDCNSWHSCAASRKGSFSIDLSNTGLAFDWDKTSDWFGDGWGNGNFMVDYTKTATTVSAKCGGWCGDCRNTEPIVLKAEVGSVTTTEPYTTETTTEATTEEPDYTTGYGSSSGGYFSTSPYTSSSTSTITTSTITYEVPDGFAVSRDTLIEEIPRLEDQWSMSVDIMPTGTMDGWSNILHVGTGGDHAIYGNRSPGIWFHSRTTKLHICNAVNGNSNYCVNTNPLVFRAWNNVEITQFKTKDGLYEYTVAIGGNVISKVTNTQPESFRDVKVMASDNFYPASFARINNFKMNSWVDGITQKLSTDSSNNYIENGPILKNRRSIQNGARFSVKANNDIHIAISRENLDRMSTKTWEIVLGGWSGTQSVIRSRLQGANLVTVKHTAEQFQEWSENFEFKMTETSIGLYDSDGNTIIEYTEFDGFSKANFLYIATGFSSDGDWVVNTKPVTIDPIKKITSLRSHVDTFLSDTFTKQPNFVQNMGDKFNRLILRAIARYEKFDGACDFARKIQADDEASAERYSRDNPCKAAAQLPKALKKWAATNAINCMKPDNPTNFLDNFNKRMDDSAAKLILKWEKISKTEC